MALLASDANNPEFTGAHNPDSRLAVQFYSKPVQNEWETAKQNRAIFQDVDYVRIIVPGDSTSIIDVPVREDHKARFPMHWAHYQNKHGGDASEIGTPLSQWPLITASQGEELRALKFKTVESIAHASDQNIQRIGMLAGMGAYAFRERAQRFLKVALDDSTVQAAEERAKAAEEETKKLREETEQKMAALREEMEAKIAQAAAPKKRGRKPKVVSA